MSVRPCPAGAMTSIDSSANDAEGIVISAGFTAYYRLYLTLSALRGLCQWRRKAVSGEQDASHFA